MRRSEREITDATKILEIVKTHNVLRLGMCKDNMPYVVPMNFGCAEKNGKLYFYLHGAIVGQKIDYIAANPNICFEMDQNHTISRAEKDHNWTALYTSVIGFGKIGILQTDAEKLAGLDILMKHCGHKGILNIPEKTLSRTCVLEIEVENITAKASPPMPN